MAIRKPRWLERALSWLNWDIFAWKVYIGDAIESAIDWIIAWINLQFELVEASQRRADAAYDKALEVDFEVRKDISFDLDRVYLALAGLDVELRDQLRIVFAELEKAVNKLIVDLDRRTDYIEGTVVALTGWWDNFVYEILPLLPTKEEVAEVVAAETEELKREQAKHGNIFTWIYDFISDPMRFFVERIDEFFERFW